MRGLPESVEENPHNHVEWSAVEEGFRLLERDLGKLQVQSLAIARQTHTHIWILAVHRAECDGFSKDFEEMGQTFKIDYQGALSGSSG